jgi:stearoyl-CoA desaturase (delta-9 desaturase)
MKITLTLILFVLMHFIGIIGPFFTGISPPAVIVAVFLYFIRMFFVTGFAHRYFSHKSFRILRWQKQIQWIMAFCFSTTLQKGAVWWASWHRHHHQHSDTEKDAHSALIYGLWHSHIGWVISGLYDKTLEKRVRDLSRCPEVMWFERDNNHLIGGLFLGITLYLLGEYLPKEFGTDGFQMLVLGLFTSTVFLYHGTFCINSLAHTLGKTRHETGDKSRNSLILAIITMGEGWHIDHHHCQTRTKQGDRWYNFDPTFYLLWCFEKIGLIKLKR